MPVYAYWEGAFLSLHRLCVMREWFCNMTFIAGLQTANGNRLIDSQELSVHLFHKSAWDITQCT